MPAIRPLARPRNLWVIAIAILSAQASAQDTRAKVVGSWLVSERRDPFEVGPVRSAITSSGKDSLAIRCFSGQLSAILVLPTSRRAFD